MGEDTVTLTRDDLHQLLLQVKPSSTEIAEGVKAYHDSEAERELTRSAQERLVMGAMGSWLKRHWKVVTTVVGALIAIGTGSWTGWGWIEHKAEEQVLERQASVKQAEAVEANTEAVTEVGRNQTELTERMRDVETRVEANSQINELLLKLRLRDPKTKRLIKSDKSLKAEVEKVTGSKVE